MSRSGCASSASDVAASRMKPSWNGRHWSGPRRILSGSQECWIAIARLASANARVIAGFPAMLAAPSLMRARTRLQESMLRSAWGRYRSGREPMAAACASSHSPLCGGQLLECFGKDLGRRVGEPLGGQRLAVGPAAQRVEDGVAVRARRRDGRVGDPGGGHHRGRAGVFAVVPSRGAHVSSREFERGSVEQVDGAVVIVHDRAPRRTRDKLGCASGTNFEVHLEECGGFRGSASTVARNRGVVEERHRGEDALPGRR